MDRIIIGRFLGATSLGYYDLAQRIFMIPIRNVTIAYVGSVSGFSKIREDDLQIQKKYIRTCCAIALICFPALTGLCVLAGPFVRVVLGEQWIELYR